MLLYDDHRKPKLLDSSVIGATKSNLFISNKNDDDDKIPTKNENTDNKPIMH